MFLYEKHVTELDINTKKNNDILMAARSRARMYGSVEEQKEAMNQKWVEEKLLFEQRMKKICGVIIDLVFLYDKQNSCRLS